MNFLGYLHDCSTFSGLLSNKTIFAVTLALSLPSQKHDVEISIVNQNKNASVVDELFHDTLSKGFDELLDGIVKALHWDEIIANSTTDNENLFDDIEGQGNLFNKGIENKTYRRHGITTYVLIRPNSQRNEY